MGSCCICGEFTDNKPEHFPGRGKMRVCDNPECGREIDEEMRDMDEREYQDAIDEVNERFGR